MKQVFNWYDTETTGISSAYDQILQSAMIRTDENLNIDMDSIQNIICQMRPDVIPHPKAFLTHNIDPDLLKQSGMSEFEFAKEIQKQFLMNPNGVVAGYNTESFDNEMIRNLFYRNLLDPYAQEWQNGNSKFDLYKLLQMTLALRPQTLQWKKKPDGSTSLKLEDLSEANEIIHENAHDALSDVFATIHVAQLIRKFNPRIFDYAKTLSSKKNVSEILNKQKPVVHFSTLYGQENNISSIILPMVTDHINKNKYLGVDLRHDPEIFLSMSIEDLKKYIFTKRADLPTDSPRIPFSSLQANKQEMIVSMSMIMSDQAYLDRSCIEVAVIEENYRKAKRHEMAIKQRLQEISLQPERPKEDVYKSLYGGFASNGDKDIGNSMHNSVSPNDERLNIEASNVFDTAIRMADKEKHFHLLLRAKWNSFHENLLAGNFSPNEVVEYADYLNRVIFEGHGPEVVNYEKFFKELEQAKIESPLNEEQLALMGRLSSHVNSLKDLALAMNDLKSELLSEAYRESSESPSINRIRSIIYPSSENKHSMEP